MPQIFVIVAPGAEKKIREGGLSAFEQNVADATEKIFGIEGENDVAVTRVMATRTLNEADIQVEVRYTAGEDEYDRGEPFDPPKEKRDELAGLIIGMASIVFPEGVEVSAWIKPFRDSVFKTTLA